MNFLYESTLSYLRLFNIKQEIELNQLPIFIVLHKLHGTKPKPAGDLCIKASLEDHLMTC